jgi:hypothetical protein
MWSYDTSVMAYQKYIVSASALGVVNIVTFFWGRAAPAAKTAHAIDQGAWASVLPGPRVNPRSDLP